MGTYTLSIDRIAEYLDRISFPLKRKPDGGFDLPVLNAETLFLLQERHLFSVPYENIDVYYRVPFTLEPEALFDKIVRRRRGGYCFELNGLFSVLLRSLGFEVTEYFARFLRDTYLPGVQEEIPMRRHRVLRVEAGGEAFLCDVGVGGVCPLHPLRFSEGLEQPQPGGELYRLDRHPFLGLIVMEKKGGLWRPYYSFTEEPQLPVDFIAADFYCQHSPDVIFTQTAMASIKRPNGRITLSGSDFKHFSPAGVEVQTAKDDEEFKRLLEKNFGIVV